MNNHPVSHWSSSQRRSVWSTGNELVNSENPHPLASLTPSEIQQTSAAVKEAYGNENEEIRFVAISLKEQNKTLSATSRQAEVIILINGLAYELTVELDGSDAKIVYENALPAGVQPLLTPEDCELAEVIVRESTELADILKERYGIQSMEEVAADPWSVHLASQEEEDMVKSPTDIPRRLVQTFLYFRPDGGDMRANHYSHPIDIVPVVDLNTKTVLQIDGLEREPPKIPMERVEYHRDMISKNSYLQTQWRSDTLQALNIVQPDGPSFTVSDSNLVEWQGWSFRVTFNYREGLVLQDVHFDNRSVMKRASLVEMSVPYADPNPPFQRKCALDVGDYGLGYCANSLELGCDCLGHIHYFDAVLNDTQGEPVPIKKAVCMHEEDDGILWKHVEYRNGHNEARRSRELVVSSIATVVNYEYLFYWRFKMDGTLDFEIRLSGELSTNLPSQAEMEKGTPDHGTSVAPDVNAQVHQHMFCARLDMVVDGEKNIVSEVDVETGALSPENPYGNIFQSKETVLQSEHEAVRDYDSQKARSWKISNADGKVNPISKKPTAYKLVPFTVGVAGPPLLTHDDCAVSIKSTFAKNHLWVTKYNPSERFPAGEYPTQATMEHIEKDGGLPTWIADRNAPLGDGEDVVLWHSFGVTHLPRVEGKTYQYHSVGVSGIGHFAHTLFCCVCSLFTDFPVMPCESTGFTLKPDGFSIGNPAIDVPPETNEKSELAPGCCAV